MYHAIYIYFNDMIVILYRVLYIFFFLSVFFVNFDFRNGSEL